MGTGDRAPERAAAEQLLAAGLTVDLSDPPSRDDLGLLAGETTTVLERPDRAPFDATVLFTDGRVLTTSAVTLIVTADGPDAPPTSLTLRRDELDIPELRTVLADAVSTFGAEETRANAVLADSLGGDPTGGHVTRVLPTAVAAPDGLAIQTIVPAEQDRVVVHYEVRWG